MAARFTPATIRIERGFIASSEGPVPIIDGDLDPARDCAGWWRWSDGDTIVTAEHPRAILVLVEDAREPVPGMRHLPIRGSMGWMVDDPEANPVRLLDR